MSATQPLPALVAAAVGPVVGKRARAAVGAKVETPATEGAAVVWAAVGAKVETLTTEGAAVAGAGTRLGAGTRAEVPAASAMKLSLSISVYDELLATAQDESILLRLR